MDLECPYCESELEVNHDDGFGYEQDVNHEMQCGNCEKSFVFTTGIIFNYEAQKADCLNTGIHDCKPTITWPKECTRLMCDMCDMCGDEKAMTKDELEDFLNQ